MISVMAQLTPQWTDLTPVVTGGIVSTICLILLFNFLKHSSKQSLDMKSLQIEIICTQKLMLLQKLDIHDGSSDEALCEKCREIAAKALASLEQQRTYLERVYAVDSRTP